MRTWVISSLVGLAGLASLASGCGDTGNECGPGTTLVDGVCTADVIDTDAGVGVNCGTGTMLVNGSCVSTAMLAAACNANTQTFNATTMTCELVAAACAQGTELNATKTGCVKATPKGSLIFSATADRLWTNLRYNNAGSVTTVGDATTVTAVGIPDNAPLYLAGLGGNNTAFNAAIAPMFQFGKRPAIPTFWDANPGNPGSTATAIDHQITVSEWKKCTLNWAVYKDPPRVDMAHYYRIVVDAAGCPADVTFGLWFNYSNTAYNAGRILGTTAGGVPNVMVTLADGTGHWERDIDPNVWTKSNTALYGNTHGAAGAGTIPDLTTNPTASFYMAAFIHNDGQSNGNGGWCASADNMTTACGIPNNIGSFLAGPPAVAAANQVGNTHTATPDSVTPLGGGFVRPYVYMPGKVGFDSVSAFGGGGITNVSTNTMPLSQIQPY